MRDPVDIVGPDYLIQSLYSAGPTNPAAMGGEIPLTWPELLAWNQATGSAYTGWELETMRYLSQVYAAQSAQSRQPNCPPPHAVAEVRVSDDQIKDAFRSLGKRNRA